LQMRLDEEALAKLDELFPPYKTSPEAFAW
jgi:hypothetical protein